jgi:hypothetical protein
MIDTLNMWLDREATAGGNPFALAPYLAEVTERQNERQGYTCTGRLGDYQVCISNSGVALLGSLAKYFLPSNVYTLTRATVQQAIEQMSDQLHTDVSAATVLRADVSTVIPTTRPPADYYSCLGGKARFERVQATPDTLYYSTHSRQLVFYDKTKEAAAKRALVPPSLADCNLLRYELRFAKQPHKQLKQAEPIQAAVLYNPDFYYMLVQQWRNEFETIKKIHRNTTIMENIKTPKDAQNALFARLLQQGGQSVIDEYIADLKARKQFSDPKYYSRLKADLNRILQTPAEGDIDLILEIEKAVANVAKYAR